MPVAEQTASAWRASHDFHCEIMADGHTPLKIGLPGSAACFAHCVPDHDRLRQEPELVERVGDALLLRDDRGVERLDPVASSSSPES
jgi:hypothetical protein